MLPPFRAFAVISLLAATLTAQVPADTESNKDSSTTWSVYFSPHGHCTEAIVSALGQAKKAVLVQAYSFTSAPIAKALSEAHKRGVRVEVILDKSQRRERYSSADFLVHAGITTSFDSAHSIAHNKVIVIDGETVLTGSFNYTKAAEEHNAENLLVIRDQHLADRYAENWREHAEHSHPYEDTRGRKNVLP